MNDKETKPIDIRDYYKGILEIAYYDKDELSLQENPIFKDEVMGLVQSARKSIKKYKTFDDHHAGILIDWYISNEQKKNFLIRIEILKEIFPPLAELVEEHEKLTGKSSAEFFQKFIGRFEILFGDLLEESEME